MRRAIAAVVTTVAGLVLLLSFKSHAGTSGAGVVATAPLTPTPTPSTSATPKAKGRTSATKPKAATTRTVTGESVDTRYGTVQVRVTLKGRQITDVTPVQLPQDNQRDIEIDGYAVPQLRQETLDAQSARINMISGATYTSGGYIQSLQSALDKAGV